MFYAGANEEFQMKSNEVYQVAKEEFQMNSNEVYHGVSKVKGTY